MIAGATNAGKTTLLRALANQIPAARAADHRGARAGTRPGPVPRAAPERGRARGTAAELRGARRDQHGRAGPPVAADEPEPGHRRRGARRRDRHHAQRDDPGQRRVAVHHPRELLDGGVQPDLHLRHPVRRAAAGGGHAHADRRRRSTSWCSSRSATILERRPPAPVRQQHPRGHRRSTAGCCPARCSRRARTAGRCRTPRSPASRAGRARLRRRAAAGEQPARPARCWPSWRRAWPAAGVFLLLAACAGLPPRPPGTPAARAGGAASRASSGRAARWPR